MKPHPAMNANVKHAATIRSTRLACTITRGSSGGRPSDVLRAFGLRDLARAVAVLGHRGRPEQARRGRGSADHPVRRSRARVPLGLFHVAHDYYYSVPVGLGSRRLAVIHIAMSTRKPRPPSQITRPSVTGPVRPSEKPPGLGSTRVWVM